MGDVITGFARRPVSESGRGSYNHAMRSRLLIVALAAAALSCAQSPTVPKTGDQPITLSLALSATELTLGTPDTITVTATNTFTQTATLLFNSDCQILVTIRSLSGAVVVPPNNVRTCSSLGTSLDIPASSSIVRRFVWTGATDLTPPGSATALPAGSYFVSAAINAANYSTFAPAVRVELITP